MGIGKEHQWALRTRLPLHQRQSTERDHNQRPTNHSWRVNLPHHPHKWGSGRTERLFEHKPDQRPPFTLLLHWHEGEVHRARGRNGTAQGDDLFLAKRPAPAPIAKHRERDSLRRERSTLQTEVKELEQVREGLRAQLETLETQILKQTEIHRTQLTAMRMEIRELRQDRGAQHSEFSSEELVEQDTPHPDYSSQTTEIQHSQNPPLPSDTSLTSHSDEPLHTNRRNAKTRSHSFNWFKWEIYWWKETLSQTQSDKTLVS